MSPDFFILTLGLYLFCVVSSLLSAIFYKKINTNFALAVFSIHVIAGICYVVSELMDNEKSGFNIFFLVFFCCGVVTSGMFIRRNIYKWIKYYSFIYLFSILLFLLSPSKMVGFIATGAHDFYQPDRFHIIENIYLIEAVDLSEQVSTGTTYKVIREMGMYYRTIERNIEIPFEIKEVTLVNFLKDSILIIKVKPTDLNQKELIITSEIYKSESRSKITKGN